MGGRPPYLVLCKMGVAARIKVPSPPIKFLFWVKWLSPLFGFILNEGGITDHGATPPYLVLSKMKVASRTMPPPPSGCVQNECAMPDHGAIPPIWSYPK